MSLPAKTASAVAPGRRITTGTPRRFGLGPNMVDRTRTAVVAVPARVTATNLGQPVRRHVTPARFVKAMYPPTFPAATSDLANLILSCEVVQVGARVPWALATIARATSVAATTANRGARSEAWIKIASGVIASTGTGAVARYLSAARLLAATKARRGTATLCRAPP